MISRLFIFLLVGLFKLFPVVAQDAPHSAPEFYPQFLDSLEVLPIEFNPSVLERFHKDPDYDYYDHLEEKEPSLWQQFKNWLGNLWRNLWKSIFGNNYAENGFLKFMYQALPYIIIAVALGFIIWVFYKLNPGAAWLEDPEAGEVFYTEEEEIIKTGNIHELIDQALAQKNFRLAVRYSYLYIIQQLSERELIQYQFDKTNSDYLNELKNTPLENSFTRVTNLYDHTWYGNFEVSEKEYFQVRPIFNDLENIIATQP
jgi:hypothetical protein